MQERRWDGEEVIAQNAFIRDLFKASRESRDAMVALHNAPPVGSVVAGRPVTEENRTRLCLDANGVWRWK